MEKSSPLIWLILFIILILPTAAGRFLLDLAGGIILVFFSISLLIALIGWIGWKRLNARMKTYESYGSNSISNENSFNETAEASDATIDIIAKDAENE
tara:strand:+ start:110 stop:403 length:294 start_codon:yes stop_codon:yes gene_type:complete